MRKLAIVLGCMAAGSGCGEEAMTGTELATFGAGCFWCVEASFERLPGVQRVTSGYAGGKTPNPTYEQVCSGRTGHAEVVRVEFDPDRISYEQLLDVFWKMHDPTSLNRQGADIGTQYRSVIFYHSEAQRLAAQASREGLAKTHSFRRPVVTQILPALQFYPAEDYHQNYFQLNATAPYCRFVIEPKLRSLAPKTPAAVPAGAPE